MSNCRHLLTLSDFSPEECHAIIDQAIALKAQWNSKKVVPLLDDKTLGMIFQKPSTRTRLSFEVGMYQLGGLASTIKDEEIQMGIRESIKDISKVFSRYFDFVMIRAMSHADIEEFARYSTIPVINGLSDLAHPCQALADILTIKEKKGRLDGLTCVYVGDGNNVCYSLRHACKIFGLTFIHSCPKGYELTKIDEDYRVIQDPMTAVENADIIYTDVWTSMGDEKEHQLRLEVFKNYTLTQEVIDKAKKEVMVMHCLPAHRDEEITEDVLEGRNSVVFDQAENRLHAQKAVLTFLGGVM